ncbi:OsmC family protein [Flavisolibacter nicotianae]|uniref:OsmC family protein n=1 Tax=Flavisolibacter nicotianae TaxID=2364882 RepID=UPI000EB018C7|nr:OsmC family protein [Flavisolibacter nicotianae]
MTKTKTIGSASAQNNGEAYRTSVVTGDFNLTVDEPTEYGGGATGPAPADYLCTALASCKAITIRMYAQRKGWRVDQVAVNVSFMKSNQGAAGVNSFFCEIRLTGALSEAQRQRILQIARICPIERLLDKPNEIVTVLAE